jgi:hypothetical protein
VRFQPWEPLFKMDGEPWESLRPVLKTDGTERFGERDLRHPPFYRA